MDLETFKNRNELLEQTRIQLKKEFIALDEVIDELIDLSRSWFLLNHLQTKPAQIFLSGMTGCGKSALVRRFVELIGFHKKTYFFDCGEITERNSPIEDTLTSVFERGAFPAIFVLDEFNKARSIDEGGRENKEPSMRIVWRLLDDGRPRVQRYRHFLDSVYDLARKLNYLISEGVTAKDGMVVQGKKLHVDLMDDRDAEEDHPNFVPISEIDTIYTLLESDYESEFDLRKHLLTLNHIDTVGFLMKAYKKGLQPAEIDATKSLVFVLANLDEAYSMSADVNPDVDANTFCRMSKKIGIPQVKAALHKRFTSEQIARLGNNMILYPAFSKKNFEDLIALKLSAINNNLQAKTGFSISFGKAFTQMIYDEGVYPAQGTRPLFSTISSLVENNIPKAIFEAYQKEIRTGGFLFNYRGNRIVISIEGKQLVSLKPNLKLKELRKNKRDEKQAIVAVHEAGHAVLSACVNRLAPKEIRSVSASHQNAGFARIEGFNNFQTLQSLKNQLVILQGGIAAERLVFGNDYVTFGSQQDLAKATSIAKGMMAELGMCNKKGFYTCTHMDIKDSLKADDHLLNQVDILLDEAYNEAVRILKREKTFHLELANYLAHKTKMNQKMFKDFADKYCTDVELKRFGFITKEGDFFRSKLSEELNKNQDHSKPKIEVTLEGMFLNKSKS